MTEIDVRSLGEEDWQDFRSVRLAALRESPDAFVSSLDEENAYAEDFWRLRMRRSQRLLAEEDERPVGVVSVRSQGTGESQICELFGLWVVPEKRGKGVAWQLVEAAARHARENDCHALAYWVGTDNGRAVAFASSFGFRPTDDRRPMRAGGNDGDEELMMLLPLGSDAGWRSAR